MSGPALNRDEAEAEDEILALRRQLGERIRAIREQKGYSQDVLAELGGLNRSYIGSLERGEHNCGLANLVRVARALEVPVTRLFGAERPEPSRRRHMALCAAAPPVRVDREQFLLLLSQCANDRPDLVMIYLERCGVVFRGSEAGRRPAAP